MPAADWLALPATVAVAVAVAVAVGAAGGGGLDTPIELRMMDAGPPSGAAAGVGLLLACVPLPAVQAQAPKTAQPGWSEAINRQLAWHGRGGVAGASAPSAPGPAIHPAHSPSLAETNAERPPLPAHMQGR